MKNSTLITLLVVGAVFVITIALLMRGKRPEPLSVPLPEVKMAVLKEGEGEKVVKNGDAVSVHYEGRLEDGTVFDSSYKRGAPFEFTVGLGQVIQGWEKGLIGMKEGEKRQLTIPSELGYGEKGQGSIPPNATLIFDVELVKIN
ncbi:MAG: FKBP-type peptidyl-prolyl cis-trans isomerase [Nanoarchaeota archaeon]|nr:FKBP-type peptidyl-prolyl cis-trans isomerase [Nanoarchaeota archaeon]